MRLPASNSAAAGLRGARSARSTEARDATFSALSPGDTNRGGEVSRIMGFKAFIGFMGSIGFMDFIAFGIFLAMRVVLKRVSCFGCADSLANSLVD